MRVHPIRGLLTKRGIGLAISLSAVAAVIAASTPRIPAQGQAAEAQLDVGSSPPLLVNAGSGALNIPFSVTCAMPFLEGECDVRTVLHYRPPGGNWNEAVRLLDGLGVGFNLPVPNARYVEYYLDVTERSTGAHMTFPPNGSSAPLRFYMLPAVGATQLAALPFGQSRPPDASFRLTWGAAPDQAGLIPGDESSTIGPQALDVDAAGRIYLLDQVNDRVQVFDPAGLLVNVIPLQLGPLGDLAVAEDGSLYVLDFVPNGPGSHPVVHYVVPSDIPNAPPQAVTTVETPEWEPALLRVEGDAAWAYGTPSDAWRPVAGNVAGLPSIQMGMPSAMGEVIRRVDPGRRIVELATPTADRPSRTRLQAPTDRYFGELALVEPDGSGGYWIVVRTWQETPSMADHHELVHVSPSGQVLEHSALENGEFADTGSLSQFRLGADGDLYQIYTDELGAEIRRFDL